MPTHTGHRATVALPPGSHAAATWTIPSDYGGMTSALLRRSRTFVEEAGVHVKILTFDPTLDLDSTRADLEARGELVPGVTLHNVWADLRELSDAQVRPREGAVPTERVRGDEGEAVRSETDEDGEVHRHLHFRADGTLAAEDRRTGAGRRITLYTRDGREGRSWKTVWAVYRSWIGRVLPDGPSYVIVDSKTMTKFFAALHRPSVYTAHLVHGAHLSAGATDAHGPLTRSRTPLIEHLDDFDAVVFLTEGQRKDVLERVGPRENTYVVPNSTDLPEGPAPDHPDRLAGVMLASLNGRKRVAHGMRAVQKATRSTGLDVTLDVYGDGPNRARLESMAADIPGVTLHGFVRGAATRLQDASFLLLTSRAEGLPLVFAEAMARGCVPIAYDIRYGPADIITDGVDGFLVPDGDVEALAAAVERFVTLDGESVRAMRAAAVATAQGYASAAVVARWADVFADVTRRRPQPEPEPVEEPTLVRRLAGMLRRAPR
ncbi:glycosyltransferase [Isoptericola sp. b515]|uniref:glycosyltransferase n=1 Tax=Isoptericola sp. b515 TaxID=3064652 RepID=UPI002712F1FE|nr:glycosyltransferase [Isoptericola sp. b515]MDO8147985.1 glycosyltransferase [Isoptericola sp. b515]